MSKPEEDKESEEYSTEEEDIEYKILTKCMDFIDTDVLGTFDSQWYNNKLTQLLHFPAVDQRVKILKRFQLEATNIEANFFTELHALHCKYQKLYRPIYKNRKLIVTGAYEPTDQEAQSTSDDDDEDLENQLKNKTKIEKEKTLEITPRDPTDLIGIPNFWLTVFQNVRYLSGMVKPHDKPILTHLQDIKVDYSENPMSFTLEFHFSPNQYFTNSVLTKEYFMKCEVNEDNPFNFDGPEIYKSKGCIINWNKDMNVTLKTVKKKQRHRSRGLVRTVTKYYENLSFFTFFTPPEVTEDTLDEEIDNELCYIMTSDFEVGNYIREKVIPKAVLFYLGETTEDEHGGSTKQNLEDTTEKSESHKETNYEAAKTANCELQ